MKLPAAVGADSLAGSVPTYNAVVLWASRVRIPARGPFLIPPPSLSPTSLPSCFTLFGRYKDKKIPFLNWSIIYKGGDGEVSASTLLQKTLVKYLNIKQQAHWLLIQQKQSAAPCRYMWLLADWVEANLDPFHDRTLYRCKEKFSLLFISHSSLHTKIIKWKRRRRGERKMEKARLLKSLLHRNCLSIQYMLYAACTDPFLILISAFPSIDNSIAPRWLGANFAAHCTSVTLQH